MTERQTALVDRVLGTIISKKLTVFLMASVFIIIHIIKPEEWVELAKWYIGGQSLVDGTKYYFKGKNNNSDL